MTLLPIKNVAKTVTELDMVQAQQKEKKPAQPGVKNVTLVGRRGITKFVVRVGRSSLPLQQTTR